MNITYTSYLKINELLDLQKLKSDPPEHDEMLFIVIHQTYELWFRQILHESDKLINDLQSAKLWSSMKTLRRILTIMKTLVSQVDILETMTPLEFNSFRSFLGQSSGFQSLQFREIEMLCGIRYQRMFDAHSEDAENLEKLTLRAAQPTYWEAFGSLLASRDLIIDTERRNEQGLIHEPSEQNQKVLMHVMTEEPELALLAELLVDLDEGLQEWRYRHVKMVERTIGRKKGTGGSDGVAYLLKTINNPVFPDLWAIRSNF